MKIKNVFSNFLIKKIEMQLTKLKSWSIKMTKIEIAYSIISTQIEIMLKW